MAAKPHALEDAPRPSTRFAAQFEEARIAAQRLGQDLDAAAAYINRNGPTPLVAPRMMACMLSASSVMGALMKAAITLMANTGER